MKVRYLKRTIYASKIGFITVAELSDFMKSQDVRLFIRDETKLILAVLKHRETESQKDIKLLNRIIKAGGFREYINELSKLRPRGD